MNRALNHSVKSPTLHARHTKALIKSTAVSCFEGGLARLHEIDTHRAAAADPPPF